MISKSVILPKLPAIYLYNYHIFNWCKHEYKIGKNMEISNDESPKKENNIKVKEIWILKFIWKISDVNKSKEISLVNES